MEAGQAASCTPCPPPYPVPSVMKYLWNMLIVILDPSRGAFWTLLCKRGFNKYFKILASIFFYFFMKQNPHNVNIMPKNYVLYFFP